MSLTRIVFWQGQPSPHQSPFIRALADYLPDTQVHAVFDHQLESDRLALGWETPDFGSARVLIAPSYKAVQDLINTDAGSTCHVFGGFRQTLVRTALPMAIRTPALLSIASEARHWTGLMGKLRILHSFAVERLYRKDIDFVLAIGHLGVRWYAMCGYPLDRVFPWGYFVERCDFDSGTAMTEATTPSIFEMCYVGRCIRGKGIDVLLNALASITEDRWRLHIVGDGPERQRLQQLAHARGIGDRVCLWGVKTNREARHLLSQSDVLVFPSEIDGWGAVVNEALMCGVPVICSDYCGAADLVRSSGYGSLFHTGSSEHLARVLREQMAKGKETVSSRKEITTWSRRVEGEAAARYFVDVLDHVQGRTTRPSAPWLT